MSGRGSDDEGSVNGTPIRLVNAELPPEMWELELKKGEFLLKAGSPLGFVYGIYEISRSFWAYSLLVLE